MTALPMRAAAAFPTPADSRAAAEVDGAHARDAAGDGIRLPWPSVRALAGDFAPGRLTVITAATGNGKTTVLLNLLHALTVRRSDAIAFRIGVTMLGTEMGADELWTSWAAMLEGVPAGVAVARSYPDLDGRALAKIDSVRRFHDGPDVARLTTWADAQEAVEDTRRRLLESLGDTVQFVNEPMPSLDRVWLAARALSARRGSLLIVDHFGRLDIGDTYGDKKRAMADLREIARATGVHLLLAVQQNREARKGSRLAAFAPPTLIGLEGGGFIEQEAVCVLGVWRPIRGIAQGEDAKSYGELRRAVEANERPIADLLEKNSVGVVLLKHRYPPVDAHPGLETRLRVYHGRITDPLARSL